MKTIAVYCLIAVGVLLGTRGSAAPPANDNFASPMIVSGFPATVTGTNVDATWESGEPKVDYGDMFDDTGDSVWFRWTSPVSGDVRIDTLGSDFDTVLGVWTGNDLGSLVTVAANNNYRDNETSAVFFHAEAGETYQVAVFSIWFHGPGAITLSITNDTSARIEGTVTGPDGTTPAQSVWVRAYGSESNGFSYVNSSPSDANGAYAVAGLTAGTYRIEFSFSDSGDYTEVYDNAFDLDSGTDIAVASGAAVSGINATLKASQITGTVTGPDGVTPLEGIFVAAYQDPSGFGYWHWSDTTYTDANGHYILYVQTGGVRRVAFEDDDGTYISEVHDDIAFLDSYYGVFDGVDIDVPAETIVSNLNASLATASKITGTVTRPDGVTPLSGMNVILYTWDEDWAGWREALNYTSTDSAGSYSIGGLTAGTYRIVFDYDGDEYVDEVYDDVPGNDLDSGTNIAVPAGSTVSNINASLALVDATPPMVVDMLRTGAAGLEVRYTGIVGREYIVQEVPSLTDQWHDVGSPDICQAGTNVISSALSASNGFIRLRMLLP